LWEFAIEDEEQGNNGLLEDRLVVIGPGVCGSS